MAIARRTERPARGERDGGAERGGAALGRRAQPPGPRGSARVGHEHEREPLDPRADRLLADPAGEPRGERVGLGRDLGRRRGQPDRRGAGREHRRGGGRDRGAIRAGRAGRGRRGHERRHGARQRPAGGRGGGEHRLLVGGRVLREQPHEPPPQPLALARRGRLLLRVALRRLGRELVDVGEDRLAERVDGVGLRARRRGPPPRSAATPAASRAGRRTAARRGCARRASRRGRGSRRCRRPRPSSPVGSSIRSTKRPSAFSTPSRTTRPNSPSIARA